MTTGEQLRAAVLAAPDDAGPRLVLADWLEERGDRLYEFHRLVARRRLWPRWENSYRVWRGAHWQTREAVPDRGWWEWWHNSRAHPALCPTWFVPREVMDRMGPTYRLKPKGGGVLLVKRFRRRGNALAALEAAWGEGDS